MMKSLDETIDLYDFPSGNQAPLLMQVFGLLFAAIAIPLSFSSPLLGIPILIVALRAATTLGGVQLDCVGQRYRVYTAYLYFLKTGKWQSTSAFPYLSVLGTNAGFNATSRGGVESTHTERVWDIYLLNEDHRQKLYLRRCASEEEAWERAGSIAFTTEKKTTIYSPQISAASLAKRNRGRRK